MLGPQQIECPSLSCSGLHFETAHEWTEETAPSNLAEKRVQMTTVSYRRASPWNQFKPILWTNAGVIWAMAIGMVTVWRVRKT